MSTETLDKLYLEWSQFTEAKTQREISLEGQLAELIIFARQAAEIYQSDFASPEEVDGAVTALLIKIKELSPTPPQQQGE